MRPFVRRALSLALLGGRSPHGDALVGAPSYDPRRYRYVSQLGLPLRSPPKRRRATLNASATVAPAPGAVGFAPHHNRRWSSDRKKLIVVQSESSALPQFSVYFPNHTITPSASGAGPSGETAN